MPVLPPSNESRERLEALLATAVDGIVIIDKAGSVQVYSPACERLFGYVSDEVVGHNVKMLMPSPYHEQHDDYLDHYKTTGEKRIIGIGREVVGRRKDGSTFPMYLSVGEGRFNGEAMFVGIIHDITDAQAAQQALREVQSELLHVSRLSAMGQMASALAHELNQPLAANMNYVNAALRTLEPLKRDEVRLAGELLAKAAAQTARAGQIIRRLRDFIEKGQSVHALAELNDVVEEALGLALVGAAVANVKVQRRFQRGLKPVSIDKIQIQQVVLNLVRNAIEAMQGGTHSVLTIATFATGNNRVTVSVSDTGPGLAPEVEGKLFLPFTTTKDTGMGIGLSVCRSIIEAHRGKIWAGTAEGGGALFSFQLPTREGEAEHDDT
ncbi:MAG: PAS domain S-box protein [Parvibaculum sp.]|nr:PAS domain S-box protein [Parvibaculum sp.]